MILKVSLGIVGSLALFCFVFFLMSPSSGSNLLRRVSAYDEAPEEENEPALPVSSLEQIRQGLQNSVGKRIEKSDRGGQLADKLAQADLKIKPAEWMVISLSIAGVAALLFMLRFGSPIMAIIGAVLGYVGTQFFLRVKQSRRRKAFDGQLAPTILSISSAIKAGYTFGQAIDLVAKNGAPPISSELTRVTREAQLGVPLNDALARMVKRNESEDLKLMLTAVQIQSQVGGNLAQILDTIEFTVRERIRIRGEIKTLTGQARASGWILIILPFALGGILMTIAPTYFGPMLKQLPGQIMLGIAGFMLLCGYGIIRKIVNVQV